MAATLLMSGKTVLITGGTGGIGKAAAIGLASMGARVGITGRDLARAERAAAAIGRESSNQLVDVFVADMSSQTEVRRLAGEVLSAYPRLDVLDKQRRRILGAPPRDRRRAGAHVRPQPPGAVSCLRASCWNGSWPAHRRVSSPFRPGRRPWGGLISTT